MYTRSSYYFLSTLFFVLLCLTTYGQQQIKGIVSDGESGKPIAFVTIGANNLSFGTTTDIDGKFSLNAQEPITSLQFHCVGYEPKTVSSISETLDIVLSPISYNLEEVIIIPGINPAHRIIKNVIKKRDDNDPSKLKSYACNIYEKFYITVDTGDYIPPHVALSDSNGPGLRGILNKTHFFMIENAIEKTHMLPDRDFQKIVANQVSGLKDPIMVFLLSQMQSPDFYSPTITIAGTDYPNPISAGSISRYSFLLEDTAYNEKSDTVFIISFRPKISANFNGLKGVLSINEDNWAIQSVKAEPAKEQELFTMRIQQLYEKTDSGQWFPKQFNTDISLKFAQIVVDTVSDTTKTRYNPGVIGVGRAYYSNINLNPTIQRSKLGVPGIEVLNSANKKNNPLWDDFRVDTLTNRERNTYTIIDSISKANNFEKKVKALYALYQGKVKWGKFNLLITDIIDYNQHEGAVLGMGIETNPSFSNRIQLNGFFNYGFRDKTSKYGGGVNYLLFSSQEFKLHFDYAFDNTESGGTSIPFASKNPFAEENYRNFLINRMDIGEHISGGFSMRLLRYGKIIAKLSYHKQRPTYNYVYNSPDYTSTPFQEFTFVETSLGFRYAYGEQLVTTPFGQRSLGTTYPIVRLNYTHGYKGIWKSEFDYNRVDIRINKTFPTNYFGDFNFVLNAGIIDKTLPAFKLFNGNGSYYPFTLFAPNSFATMRMNEFISDRYVALFFTYDLKDLLWKIDKGIFRPEFALTTNIGWGDINHISYHEDITDSSMNQGYYESGLAINNIITLGPIGLGFAAAYRYGPYSFAQFNDNIAWKIAIKIGF